MSFLAQILNSYEQLTKLLDQGYASYHPKLVDVAGSVNAALFLSQSINWMRYAHFSRKEDCFYRTIEGWHGEIGLTRTEQFTARQLLKERGLLSESLRGTPAKLTFSIELNTLSHRFLRRDWQWSNPTAIKELLGAQVTVSRGLFTVCKNAKAAVLLGKLIHATRQSIASRVLVKNDYQRMDVFELRRSLGMSRFELEHARKTLRELHLLDEKLLGIPPRIFWKINFETLKNLIIEHSNKEKINAYLINQGVKNDVEATNLDCFRKNQKQDLGKTRNMFQEKPETSMQESGKLTFQNPANKLAGNQHNSLQESSALISSSLKSSSPKNTSPLPPSTEQKVKEVEVDLNLKNETKVELCWPRNFSEDERKAAKKMMKHLTAEVQQELIDELTGQNLQKPILSKLGYLSVLVKKVSDDSFIPSYAPKIKSNRAAHQALERPDKGTAPAVREIPEEARKFLDAFKKGRRLINEN